MDICIYIYINIYIYDMYIYMVYVYIYIYITNILFFKLLFGGAETQLELYILTCKSIKLS